MEGVLFSLSATINGFENPFIALLLFVSIALFLYSKSKRNALHFLVTMATTGIAIAVIKTFVAVPRPSDALMFNETSRFPSMHAGFTVVIAYYLALHVATFLKTHYRLLVGYALGGVLLLIVVLSRLYLHVHTPLDIIVGCAIGALLTYVVRRVLYS